MPGSPPISDFTSIFPILARFQPPGKFPDGNPGEQMIPEFSKDPSFKNQPPDSPIEQIAARLVVFPSPTDIYVSGSCVRIAKNLYITARHVITDYIEQFGTKNLQVDWECWAVHVLPGPEYSIWRLDRAWLSADSDLALFHTKPHNNIAAATLKAPCVRLELSPPTIGERIVGFGYHSSCGQISVDNRGSRHIEINGFGAASVGEVKAVHQIRRDQRLPFPCYQVNARFDGGMSGGPLLSSRGNLCGITCANYELQDPAEEAISYAATLWPLMAIPIDIDRRGRQIQLCYPLLTLAREGVITAIGWERVSLTPTPGTPNYNVRFQ